MFREKPKIRLGPPPKTKNSSVSKSMKSNKAKGTLPEITLKKKLDKSGIKGYRLNFSDIPGSPDIAFPRKKVAVFVNGCFWHRCPYCSLKLPASNRIFWKRKFDRNKERDRLKKTRLNKMGWRTITIWECQITKRLNKAVARLYRKLDYKRLIS